MKFPKTPDFINLYIFPEKTCKMISEETAQRKKELINTLMLSFALNFFLLFIIPILFEPISLSLLFLSFSLWIFTFLSIILIEYLTFLASKLMKGKGTFFGQLKITNLALVNAFSAAIIANLFYSFEIAGEEFVWGIYFLFYIILIYLNYEKIESVHKIKETIIPSIVYGLLAAISFGMWNSILVFVSSVF